MSWDDDIGAGNKSEKKGSNKDLFLRLEEGNNVIRIISPMFQYLTHSGIKKDDDKGFGRKVGCSRTEGQDKCPLCDLGFRASPRFFLGVINRKKNTYQVLDISWSTMKDIKSLNAQVDVWGSPLKYDLNIIKSPSTPQKYYQVQPIPHKPLSLSDEKLRDSANLEELEAKCAPLSPETVQKIIDGIKKDGSLEMPKEDPRFPKKDTVASAPAVKSKAAPVVNMAEEDTLDDIFPEYNAETTSV